MALCLLPGAPLAGQAVVRPGAAGDEAFDSADALGRARREQARFEQRRVRKLPASWGGSAGECDEHVGRFCTWYEEGEWLPEPEPAEVRELRSGLISYLDSVQSLIPGDDWLLGQRVWYRAEAERWDDALRAARSCGGGSPWWCAALAGLTLHGQGRYVEADDAFSRALELMEPERAERWRTPRPALDGDAGDELDRRGSDRRWFDWLWALADPLYLVSGNDRRTAHYARWTVSTLRERARNPFQIPWGRDLEELTIRHGWEIGWERQRSSGLRQQDAVVGHKHPEGRDFMPSGRVLRDPAGATERDLRADRARPRSLYAPAYAPVLLPVEGQVAVFPRGDSFAVIATQYLPPDTTWRRPGPDTRPWMNAGDATGRPDRSGLYLLPAPLSEERAEARRDTFPHVERTGGLEGALTLRGPAGVWTLSSESWSPAGRRAGRMRVGLRYDAVPPDVLTLSDLLLVRGGGGGDPATLESAADRALTRTEVASDQPLGVVWEVGGLGWTPETLRYALFVERADRSLFRRLWERVGLADRDRPLTLAWEEPGPSTPGGVLRGLELDLPVLDAGTYRVRLEVRVVGRSPLGSEASFLVR